MLTGPSYIPQTVKKIIILLHGYGADGANLFDCGTMIADDLSNDIAIYAPNAIERCEMGIGYQWFGLPDMASFTLENGIHKALPRLLEFIDAVVTKHKLTHKDVALFGFSQGSMISIAALYHRNFGAVIGVAGILIKNIDHPIKEPTTPVLLAHGTHDMIVPYHSMIMAQTILAHDNVVVETLTRDGLEHTIDDTIIDESIDFLKKFFI